MRVLVLYAHPVETSFVSALHIEAVKALRARGHEVDDCDLYIEGFDPVLSRQDRLDYHDVSVNRARVASYVDRLLAAEALVLIFPVWNYGYPAILKGVFDKVFLPGATFTLSDNGDYTPTLGNIKRLATVCTYGGGWLRSLLMGDPPRRVVMRSVRGLISWRAPCRYLAHYGMNRTTLERRQRFLGEVKAYFSTW